MSHDSPAIPRPARRAARADRNADEPSTSELAAVERVLQHLPLPIALLGSEGRVFWHNVSFARQLESGGDVGRLLGGPLGGPRAGTSTDPDSPATGVGADGHRRRIHAMPFGNLSVVAVEQVTRSGPAPMVLALRARIEELERESLTDPLTGAWNRRYIDRVLRTEVARSLRQRQPLSVMICDIDHFKRVNDTHGHAAGDDVLQDFVRTLGSGVRASDVLSRWGGEEFLVCAPATSRAGATVLAERLRAGVESHGFSIGNPVTASFGVAELQLGEDAASLLARADRALYQAKEGGRNRVVHDPGVGFEAAGQRTLVELVWSDDYACSEATIDAQHEELFRLANGVIGRGLLQRQSPADFIAAFDELLGHIVQHFGDEERVLAAHAYAELAQHHYIHQRLLERACGLRAAAVAGELTTATLIDFLAFEVVTAHLLTCDRRFFPLFAGSAATA